MADFVAGLWDRLTKEIAQSSPLDLLIKLLATIILAGSIYATQWLLRHLWRWLSTEIPPWWACCRKLARAQAAIDDKGPGLWLTINPNPLPSIVRKLADTGKLILTIANLKGGVGKTTLTANLAAYFANPFNADRPSRRVLVLDLDFQGSLSSMLFAGTQWRPDGDRLSFASQLVNGDINAGFRGQLGQPVTGVDRARGVSAFYDLARVENREMVRWLIGDETADIRYRLAHLLLSDAVLPHFDVILIDAPPRLTTASIQALCASTHVLIPAIPDPLGGDDPVGYFGRQLQAHEALFPYLKVLGVVGTLTDRRQRGEEERALKRAGDRLQAAVEGANGSLQCVRVKGRTFEFPHSCSLRRSTPLARAVTNGIPYVSLGETQKGRAVRGMIDAIGNEVVQRWQP